MSAKKLQKSQIKIELFKLIREILNFYNIFLKSFIYNCFLNFKLSIL